ncbi:ROK family protein [Paenibacillus marinisediminis]
MKWVAVDIGGTNTKICICDERGNIEQFSEYETESHKGGQRVIDKLLEQIATYQDYDAIAISTAGQVNAEEGYIVYANENIPGYTGMKIKEIVEAKFNKPVKVENDVNAAALGEAHFGAAKAFDDFLCLTFGTGIGGAIVINRKIYKGANGVAAEFGHIFTHPLTDHTTTGRKPYYEAFASTTALVQQAAHVDPECVNGRILFHKIDQGNEQLQQVLDRWMDEVAIGLASLVHIFNPSAIVVGGGVMEQEELVRMIEARMKLLVMESFRDVKLLRASLGNKAGVLGAVSLFLRDEI